MLAVSDNILENDYLKAVFSENNGVTLLNKKTGEEYSGLHYFESVDDAGDPWRFKPAGDRTYTKGPVRIELVENGCLSATVRTYTELGSGKDNSKITITSDFTLTRSGRHLKVRTVIDNDRRDYRLRVCFPTGIVTDKTYAGGQFHVDERPTHMPDMSEWKEPVDGYPNFGFCGLSDRKRGFAVLNLGIPEYFIAGEQKDVITLTLLRSTRLKLLPEDIAEKQAGNAQMHGRITLNYALYPHAGGWTEGGVLEEYRRFASPVLFCQTLGEITRRSPGNIF